MNAHIDPHFYHFLAEGNIICGIEADTSLQAIEQLAQRLSHNTAGMNKKQHCRSCYGPRRNNADSYCLWAGCPACSNVRSG